VLCVVELEGRGWADMGGRKLEQVTPALSEFAAMDDITVPSLSSGIVGSRFVSQDEIDAAKARRDQQWKAAYARSVAPKFRRRAMFSLGVTAD
jgi:hypothetical protein